DKLTPPHPTRHNLRFRRAPFCGALPPHLSCALLQSSTVLFRHSSCGPPPRSFSVRSPAESISIMLLHYTTVHPPALHRHSLWVRPSALSHALPCAFSPALRRALLKRSSEKLTNKQTSKP
ncbi:unnamed protein product, partial [Tuber aestivum]